MIKKMASILSIVFFVSACARPEYVQAGEPSTDTQKPDAQCPYVLPATDLCLTAEWETPPDSSKYNSMKVTITGNNIESFDELTALLWMPSMGHGSSPVKIEKTDENTYRIYDMFFVMPGSWEVRITLKKSGQSVDQVFLPYIL